MATEDVVYAVPVIVEVDTDSGEVVRVNVDDGSAKLDPGENPESEAVKIAETTGWPAWEFGF